VDIPIGAPSAHGVDPAGVAALISALDDDPRIEPHGLIVQRHGHRIVEAYWAPHSAGRTRLVYSLSKSFTSAALGLAIGEGRLDLDDLVADHLTAELEGIADERTRSIRVRDIASMASGHDHEMLLEAVAADPDDPVRGFFRIPPARPPGTVFAYSQPTVLALATILQRLTGERLSDYLRPRLLDPIGIGDLRWREHRPGIEPGYTGVYTDLDAIARLGQLHLDDGRTGQARVLPEGWVAQASRVQTENPGEPHPDWQQGYGFGMWMSRHGYRGDGAFGQLMLVLPEHDLVVAMFAHVVDMQSELDHIWAHLLPAIDRRSTEEDDAALAARIGHLALATVAQRLGGIASDGSDLGGSEGRYERDPSATSHPTLTAIDIDRDQIVLHEANGADLAVPISTGWTEASGHPVAASACRLPDGRIAVDLAFVETPHRLELSADPGTRTFTAVWPAAPLFGLGIDPALATMGAPAR
jgi:CubicO group peptidase (beta-lactamase class C family)